MRILVIGSGGREHAMVWKLAQSPRTKGIFCAPGNAGIGQIAECVPIAVDDLAGLVAFVKRQKIDLTMVGPELPLSRGLVDSFQRNNLRIVGPTQAAAQMEASKVFAKEFMLRHRIPTASAKAFLQPEAAKEYLRTRGVPIVVKADGLASGKGVVVARTEAEAISAIDDIMGRKLYGDAGRRILLEDCLTGAEVSLLVCSDGMTTIPMPAAQDHKRIFDGDRGPNTGGMGAYSPAPVMDAGLQDRVMNEIVFPTLSALKREARPYSGILYVGLMLTDQGPQVLEFNCRFGDPETQAILPLLATDLVDLLEAIADGTLAGAKVEWDPRSACCVVLAAPGYPEHPETGGVIEGLKAASEETGVVVFHAGTATNDDGVVTSGGRVLGVTGVGNDLAEARRRAYSAVNAIRFPGMQYRKDIALAALSK